MLWNSTYLTKYNINDFIVKEFEGEGRIYQFVKEENKTLRAKIWNYEKENRKMFKQLESWGMINEISNEAKPFVDSATLFKVFNDT